MVKKPISRVDSRNDLTDYFDDLNDFFVDLVGYFVVFVDFFDYFDDFVVDFRNFRDFKVITKYILTSTILPFILWKGNIKERFMDKKKNIAFLLGVILVLVVFAYPAYTNFLNKAVNNQTVNSTAKIHSDVQKQISSLKVSKPTYGNYDRKNYTSAYQRYFKNNVKYTSIRKYTFDNSVYNNGAYTDPYSNKPLEYKKSQYDHIVPLAYVDRMGGYLWSNKEKRAFADNPENGVNVLGRLNMQKKDKGPAEWLPPTNRVDYCYSFAYIINKNNLSVTNADKSALEKCVSGHTEAHLLSDLK